jgi:hypothetical protein
LLTGAEFIGRGLFFVAPVPKTAHPARYTKNMNNEIKSKLEYGSTWKLLGLGIITYAVYFAHYIKKQTVVINEHCEENERISDSFITFIMVISYLSLGFFLTSCSGLPVPLRAAHHR